MKLTRRKYSRNGHRYSRAYYCYYNMVNRCTRPETKGYSAYGGRGIQVIWPDFDSFYSDMGDPPPRGTIERIDNDGHYCKSNCRWATRAEQGANRSLTSYCLITHNGETHYLADWARLKGIKPSTLWMRLYHYGWSVEKSLCA